MKTQKAVKISIVQYTPDFLSVKVSWDVSFVRFTHLKHEHQPGGERGQVGNQDLRCEPRGRQQPPREGQHEEVNRVHVHEVIRIDDGHLARRQYVVCCGYSTETKEQR